MTNHLMVDIETLGTSPGAVIASIGAVKFDESGLTDKFHSRVDIESCVDIGLQIEPQTMLWWLDQSEEAQVELQGDQHIKNALTSFNAFYGDTDYIWAKPPSFDCIVLGEAYDRLNMVEPWDHRDKRCFRTLDNLPHNVQVPKDDKVHHKAVDDARYQAAKAYQILNLYNRIVFYPADDVNLGTEKVPDGSDQQ